MRCSSLEIRLLHWECSYQLPRHRKAPDRGQNCSLVFTNSHHLHIPFNSSLSSLSISLSLCLRHILSLLIAATLCAASLSSAGRLLRLRFTFLCPTPLLRSHLLKSAVYSPNLVDWVGSDDIWSSSVLIRSSISSGEYRSLQPEVESVT